MVGARRASSTHPGTGGKDVLGSASNSHKQGVRKGAYRDANNFIGIMDGAEFLSARVPYVSAATEGATSSYSLKGGE